MNTSNPDVRLCGQQELKDFLTSRGPGTLIDVREYPEYAAGRIPGSQLIPLGEIANRVSEIDSSQPVYLVCRTDRRSREAAKQLYLKGFKDVRPIAGGFAAWQGAGGAVEGDERPPWSLERQVRFTAGAIVFASVLLGATVWGPSVWLAGLVGAGLSIAAATDTCAMAMVLARMPWNRNRAVSRKRAAETGQ